MLFWDSSAIVPLLLDRPLRGQRRPSVPRPEGVHRRPVQVAGWVLHLPDAVPALVHREEGVLRELLGFEPVPRHQAERLEEPCPLQLEEEIELHGSGPPRAAAAGSAARWRAWSRMSA